MQNPNLQVEGVVNEAQQRALQVNILRDEQRHKPDHGRAPIPALILRVERAILAAVGRLPVVHGDERGAYDDWRHE